jgi:proteasome accessory factor B
VREAAFDPLSAALEKRVLVNFGYLKPGEDTARTRLVAPIALIQHQGRWLLHAEDQHVHERRNFLLRRIVTPVTSTSHHFPAYSAEATSDALADLERVWQERTAIVSVEPHTDAATRLAKRRGTEHLDDGQLQLHYSDINLFADELAGFGPEVLVLSPPELRDAVLTRLLRTAADHG